MSYLSPEVLKVPGPTYYFGEDSLEAKIIFHDADKKKIVKSVIQGRNFPAYSIGTATRVDNKAKKIQTATPGPAAYDSLDSFKSMIKKRVPVFQYVNDHCARSHSFV